VGWILDLAVVAVAILVCTSLALLAWTLGISATRALRRLRRDILLARLELAVAERRLRGRPAPAAEIAAERAITEGEA